MFEALQEAISQLPARQNQVLVMCKIQGKKQKEVAEELGISVKAVEKNLDKAKHRLPDLSHESLISFFNPEKLK